MMRLTKLPELVYTICLRNELSNVPYKELDLLYPLLDQGRAFSVRWGEGMEERGQLSRAVFKEGILVMGT